MHKNVILFMHSIACQSAGVLGMAATTKCAIAAGSSALVGGTQYIFSKTFGQNDDDDDEEEQDWKSGFHSLTACIWNDYQIDSKWMQILN